MNVQLTMVISNSKRNAKQRYHKRRAVFLHFCLSRGKMFADASGMVWPLSVRNTSTIREEMKSVCRRILPLSQGTGGLNGSNKAYKP